MEACPTCDSRVPTLSHRTAAAGHAPKQPNSLPVEYEDKYEKLNASLQLKWSSLMEEGDYKTSSFYRKVKVLLISWSEGSDDLHTQPEVDELGRIFKDTFRFQVIPALLDHRPSAPLAQTQLNYHVAQFLYKEDGPRTLLIVYYAGHGTPGNFPGSLKLTGKRTSDDPDEADAVVWNHVESSLEYTKSDVLEIFDCCYAGDYARAPTYQSRATRSFEFLGACSSQSLTRSPGEESFTNALIWALNTLAKNEGRFTISQLARTIREKAPHFPDDQIPVHLQRGLTSLERIVLAPLSDQNDSKELVPRGQDETAESKAKGLLTLNFIFETPPKAQHIERIAKALNTQIKFDKIPINQIVWGGLHSYGEVQPSVGLQSRIMQAIVGFKEGAARGKLSRSRGSLESLLTPDSGVSPSSDLVTDQQSTGSPSRTRRRTIGSADLDSGMPQSSTDNHAPACKKPRR